MKKGKYGTPGRIKSIFINAHIYSLTYTRQSRLLVLFVLFLQISCYFCVDSEFVYFKYDFELKFFPPSPCL